MCTESPCDGWAIESFFILTLSAHHTGNLPSDMFPKLCPLATLLFKLCFYCQLFPSKIGISCHFGDPPHMCIVHTCICKGVVTSLLICLGKSTHTTVMVDKSSNSLVLFDGSASLQRMRAPGLSFIPCFILSDHSISVKPRHLSTSPF